MNDLLQIRKLPDGRLQARRLDGQPLTAKDKQKTNSLALAAHPAGSVAKYRSPLEALAPSIFVENTPDEVERIVTVWRDLLGLQLDRDRVRKNLTSLKQWRTKRGVV